MAPRVRLILSIRFQIVVLSAYKQITAQSSNVLADIGEENYDRAFGFIRPGKLTSKSFTLQHNSTYVFSYMGCRRHGYPAHRN